MNKNKWLFIVGVIVVLGAAGWIYFLRTQVIAAVSEHEKEAVATAVRAKAPQYVMASDFVSTDAKHIDQVFGALWKAIQSPEYVRMKIWVSGYTVLWSNLSELNGQKFPPFDEFDDAMKGEVAFDLETQKTENIGERQYDVLSETYVPFLGPDGKVAGIIEVYSVPTNYDAQISAGTIQALPLPIGAAVVVYGAFAAGLIAYEKKKKAAMPPSA